MSGFAHRLLSQSLRGRRPPTQFAPVDWANPLSRGLVYLPVMAAGARDASGFSPASALMTLGGNMKFTHGPFGPSLYLPGGSSDTASFKLPNGTTYPIYGSLNGTIEVLCSMTAVAVRAHLFGLADVNNLTSGVHRALIAFNGSSPYNIYEWDSAGGDNDTTVQWRVDGSGPATLQHYFYTWGKYAGQATASQQYYRDGAEFASSTKTLNNIGVNSCYVHIGGKISSGTVTFTAHLYKLAVYNEKLTPYRVRALTRHPYAQFATYPDYQVYSAPPPPTFKSAWAMNANMNYR